MAAHSTILVWTCPGSLPEESGRLQSMGSQRAGHDQVTFTSSLKQHGFELCGSTYTQIVFNNTTQSPAG